MPSRGSLKTAGQAGLLLAAAFLLWRFFYIRQIEVTGTSQLDPKAVEHLTRQQLRQHIWSRNLITLGLVPLESELLKQDQRLKTVTLQRRWPRGLVVAVTERRPALGWKSGDQLLALDASGTAIGPVAAGQKLPVVVDRSRLPVKPGDRVVPVRFIAFCTTLLEQLPQRTGLELRGLEVPESTSELYAMTNKGYSIRFDTTRPVGEQVTDLVNVLAALSKLKKTPSQYIDLRVQHKAYYR
ncbi:FtsQ-type POTRA domain-containing protein [Candidatus Parcubacteria bacterium]|nr:FtsQ-type POTRA domain-containing protein [Candidatus Parcubacteria bacterium]